MSGTEPHCESTNTHNAATGKLSKDRNACVLMTVQLCQTLCATMMSCVSAKSSICMHMCMYIMLCPCCCVFHDVLSV